MKRSNCGTVKATASSASLTSASVIGDASARSKVLVEFAAVVVLGLRRNLSETTRNGLPRFGGGPERAPATLGLYEGEERRRRSLLMQQHRDGQAKSIPPRSSLLGSDRTPFIGGSGRGRTRLSRRLPWVQSADESGR